MCHAIYSGHESVHAVGSRHGLERQACSPQPVAYRSFVCVCVCKHVHMSSITAEVLASKRPLPWATAKASISRPCLPSSSRKHLIAWRTMVRQSSLQPIQLITSCASLGRRLFNCGHVSIDLMTPEKTVAGLVSSAPCLVIPMPCIILMRTFSHEFRPLNGLKEHGKS